MGPRVDVIMPAYNAERFLPEAIASIRAQTLPPSRIIVVDDGSTDGTADWLAAQANLIVERQENAGAGAARNRAIGLSDAPVLAFLDADDLWLPTYLETQLGLIDTRQELDASFVQVEQFDEATGETSIIPGLIPTAMVIRRAALDRAGPFEETPGSADFFAWFLAAKDRGLTFAVHNEVLARRRIHDRNSSREAVKKRHYVRALKQSLDRRRRGP